MEASGVPDQPSLRIAMAECPVCGRKTKNPKFCSRSCAAKLNNVLTPKRRPGGRCCVCNKPIARRDRYCPAHKPEHYRERREPLRTFLTPSKERNWRDANIRRDARQTYLAAYPYRCVACGYDKRIDVCHKRPLASFPEETPLAVVNALDNLVGLCPNCHWEFDRGLLRL